MYTGKTLHSRNSVGKLNDNAQVAGTGHKVELSDVSYDGDTDSLFAALGIKAVFVDRAVAELV